MKYLASSLGVAGVFAISWLSLNAQVVTVKSGKWSAPSTWSNSIVPDATTPNILVVHSVTLPSDTTLIVNDVTLAAPLIIDTDAELILTHDPATGVDLRITTGSLVVSGKIVCRDSATFAGTSTANTFFNDGASYEHQYFNTAGEPPIASWSSSSTLLITGYVFGRSLNSPNWNQSYGNIIYDCAAQRSGSFVEMLGNIQHIKGDFIVRNTNGGVLRFSLDKTTLTNTDIGGDLIIEGKSEFWLGRNSNLQLHIAGNLLFHSTATASSYLTTTGQSDVTIDGSVFINSTAPFRFASSGGGTGILRVKKNFLLSNGIATVLPVGSGQLFFEGKGDHYLHVSGDLTTGIDVIVADSSSLTITNNSKIGGNLVLQNGSRLILPTQMTLNGNLEVQNGGDIFEHRGTLQLTGSTAQTLNINSDTLYNITAIKSSASSITMTGKLNLRGILSIKSQGIDFRSNGNLHLLSLSDNGDDDAVIDVIPPGSIISGSIIDNRYMSGEGKIYRYLSSSVQTATVADCKDDFPVTGTFVDPSTGGGIASASPSFFQYDETLTGDNGWTNYPVTGLAADNLLRAGKGYAAYIRRATTPTVWDVGGVANQHEINFSLTFTPHGDILNDGWNLVGNPYPCHILWDAIDGWQKFNVADKVVVKDNGTGMFRYWSEGIGNLTNGRIAKGQAFWIQTTNAGAALQINELAKTTTNTEFHRKATSHIDYLELILQHEGVEDRAYLRQKAFSDLMLDQYDVLKWDNDHFNIAFVADSMKLAVQNVAHLVCDTQIPIEIFFSRNANGQWVTPPFGKYCLRSTAFGTFQHATIMLIDNFTSQFVSLKNDYFFTVTQDERSYAANRFSVEIRSDQDIRNVKVRTDDFRCPSSPPFRLEFQNLQPGVTYEIWLNNILFHTHHAAVDTFSMLWREDPTLTGSNLLEIKARTVCEYQLIWRQTIQRGDYAPVPTIIDYGGQLEVNTTGKIQWFFEGTQISGANAMQYVPTQTGHYQIEVNVNECIARADHWFHRATETIQCYPTPALSEIFVVPAAGDEIYDIDITDMSGRKINLERRAEGSTVRIITQPLIPGSYVVRITTTQGVSVKKIIKL